VDFVQAFYARTGLRSGRADGPAPATTDDRAHASSFRCPWRHQPRIIVILGGFAIERPLCDRATPTIAVRVMRA
jgi:hypothetical protein